MSPTFSNIPEPPQDAGHRRLHFGCGTLLGIVLGYILGVRMMWRFGIASDWFFILIVAAVALACGKAAARWGDRFWHWILGEPFRW